MKKFLAVLVLLLCQSCKTPCNQSSIAQSLSNGIVSQWDCKNPIQVQMDIDSKLASVGLCAQVDSAKSKGLKGGAIAGMVCPLATSALQQLVAQQVPANWQCDPNKVGANAFAGLNALCNLIPF